MADESYNFTTARTRLEEIVTQVRKKDTSLEKSLDLLEEGVRLANACTELIDRADWAAAGASGVQDAEAAEAGGSAETDAGAEASGAEDDASAEAAEAAVPDELDEPGETDDAAVADDLVGEDSALECDLDPDEETA